MKRFGLPMLLSAGYASILFLVFSSDFSKEHSFLLEIKSDVPTAKTMEKAAPRFESALTGRIAKLGHGQTHFAATPAASSASDEQSPESAAAAHQ
jgi:hypothetical protein